MWEYLAGLFDGEGCPNISKSVKWKNPLKPVEGVFIKLEITGESNHLHLIKQFLMDEGIYSGVLVGNKGKEINGWRVNTSFKLVISSHNGVKLFLINILPFLLLKKDVCKITLEGIFLKEQLKNKYGAISENLYLFDKLRHKIHKYARKGRKTLKSW